MDFNLPTYPTVPQDPNQFLLIKVQRGKRASCDAKGSLILYGRVMYIYYVSGNTILSSQTGSECLAHSLYFLFLLCPYSQFFLFVLIEVRRSKIVSSDTKGFFFKESSIFCEYLNYYCFYIVELINCTESQACNSFACS